MWKPFTIILLVSCSALAIPAYTRATDLPLSGIELARLIFGDTIRQPIIDSANSTVVAELVSDWGLSEALLEKHELSAVHPMRIAVQLEGSTKKNDGVPHTSLNNRAPTVASLFFDGGDLLKVEARIDIQNSNLPSNPWAGLGVNVMNMIWRHVSIARASPHISIQSMLDSVRVLSPFYRLEAYYVEINWHSTLEPEDMLLELASGERFWVVRSMCFRHSIESYDQNENIPQDGKPYIRYLLLRSNGKRGSDVIVSRYPGF